MVVELRGDEVEAESVLADQLEALYRRRPLLHLRCPAGGVQFLSQPLELFDLFEQRHVRNGLVILAVLLGNFLVAEEQVIKEDPVLDVGSLLNGRIRSIVGTILQCRCNSSSE